jgi:hypothetical protein
MRVFRHIFLQVYKNFIDYISMIRPSPRVLNALLLSLLMVVVFRSFAATPNPGHPWSQVGDGLWAATGTTQYRTFTFPNSDANVLTDYTMTQGGLIYGSAASATTILPKDTNATRYLTNKGGSNNPAWSTVTLSNGVDGILSSTNGGTGNASTSFTGQTSGRTYRLPDTNTTILTTSTLVTLDQGGTNANLLASASNGGIYYSTASAAAILAGIASANRVLMSGNSAAPSWSTATYPSTVTASGSVLVSDGTNVVSQDQMILTLPTRAFAATGAMSAVVMSSQSVFRVGLFNVPQTINVNMISASVTTVTTGAAMKLCLYDNAGSLLVNATTSTPAANATLSTTTASTVQLRPGNYYLAIGCGAACNVTVNYWTTTTASPLTTLTPASKKVYEGTVTMSGGGACNATLPTITAAVNSTPVGRLDN